MAPNGKRARAGGRTRLLAGLLTFRSGLGMLRDEPVPGTALAVSREIPGPYGRPTEIFEVLTARCAP